MRALLPLLLWTGRAPAAESFGGYNFYLGDPHVHTGVSGDGGSSDLGDCKGDCGEAASVFEVARARGLDWISVSDHVTSSPYPAAEAEEFNWMLELGRAANDEENGFVTLPGAEVWVNPSSLGKMGHVTLLFFGTDEEVADLTIEDMQFKASPNGQFTTCEGVWEWMGDREIALGPTLMIPHHPGAVIPGGWHWSECYNETWMPAVEVYSEHGNSLSEDDLYDPIWSGTWVDGTVGVAMDPEGLALRMGFLGGSDSHDTQPGDICHLDSQLTNHPYGGGQTVVVTQEGEQFDRQAIYQAILHHHTYATSGPMLPVLISWHSGGALLGELGDNPAVPPGQDVDVRLEVPEGDAASIIGVELLGPEGSWSLTETETGSWEGQLGSDEIPAYVIPRVELDGVTWYADRTECEDGGADETEYLWLSPAWFDEGSSDLDGDGISYLDGDCDDGNPNVSPAATEIWYDGLDQDCDGRDDDQDEDGFGVELDCDDTDASIWPGAPEIGDDGVDQDCSGADSTDRQPGVPGGLVLLPGPPSGPQLGEHPPSTGCSTATGGPGRLAAALLALVALARRRKPARHLPR